MSSKMAVALMVAGSFFLTACSEKPQTLGTRSDASPYSGPTGPAASYSAAGWKAGDKTSWEQALRARAQYGQNDYIRAP